MVIAPVFGFDDYQDYYRKTQSGQFLKGVKVPLLAVQVKVSTLAAACRTGRTDKITSRQDRFAVVLSRCLPFT